MYQSVPEVIPQQNSLHCIGDPCPCCKLDSVRGF